MEQRETVGKVSSELLQKTPESRDPIEIQREMQKEYITELWNCIQTDLNKYTEPFYVVVITKNERLMPNVFRNYFFSRSTCPTPDYDQTVWQYDAKKTQLTYLWTIPSREASIHLKNHALEIADDEGGLLAFVLAFADGSLFKLAKKLNGELEDSPILEESV